MRKHFYLVTDHEDQDRVGGISVFDTRMSHPNKNEEAAIRIFDDEEGDFRKVGEQVGLGYHDFDGEEQYNDNDYVAEIMQAKVRSVDRKWAEKAGIEEVVYND